MPQATEIITLPADKPKLIILMCVIPVVLIQYVTIRQSFHSQYFVSVIKKATYFGSTGQPSSGFAFRNVKKEAI
jgi:hypothetical protein